MTTQTHTHQQFIEELSKKMLVEKVTDPVLLKTIYNTERVRSNLETHLNKTVVDIEFYLIQPNSLVEHQTALVVYREVPNIIPDTSHNQPPKKDVYNLNFKVVDVPSSISDHVIVALSKWLFVPQTTADLKSDIFVKTDSWIHFYIARSNSLALDPQLTPRDPFVVSHDALRQSFTRISDELDKLYADLDKYLLNKFNAQEYLVNGKTTLV